MTDSEIDWLVYVDTPDWSRDADWRQYISTEVRAAWLTLTYEQTWNMPRARTACRETSHLGP